MDDPCVNGDNDQGDAEGMIAAFTFLKGISYTVRGRDARTGRTFTADRHIVNIRTIINHLLSKSIFKILMSYMLLMTFILI